MALNTDMLPWVALINNQSRSTDATILNTMKMYGIAFAHSRRFHVASTAPRVGRSSTFVVIHATHDPFTVLSIFCKDRTVETTLKRCLHADAISRNCEYGGKSK